MHSLVSSECQINGRRERPRRFNYWYLVGKGVSSVLLFSFFSEIFTPVISVRLAGESRNLLEFS